MIPFSAEGVDEAFKQVEEKYSEINTAAMREAEAGLKNDLRNQVLAAGLGHKVANAWRSRTYPGVGYSLSPAGVVWTNAPDIINAYDKGVTIVPINGKKALAIPSKNVPNTRGPGGRIQKMNTVEVESAFNQELIILPRNGKLLGFVEAVGGRNGRGIRQATKRRVAQGRAPKLIHMFTFTRSVKVAKRLDIQKPYQAWASRLPQIIDGKTNHVI